MPRFDGSGPMGFGPMTGGGRGYCVSGPKSEGARYFGRRGNSAAGGGRGFRNCFYATGLPGWIRQQRGMQAFGAGAPVSLSSEEESSALKSREDYLKAELEAVQSRLQNLQDK
ncbi:MAG: DUF5320 domain-containing protein [Candidatus Omnitrophica bacterium]|nr:DUF5320 domain-containing protein [Candidatus Omnitrophota bacterium]MDD5042439.1 DUF5320 domain-containing protein [Candidatus Omnitrophota bacterium]